MADYPWPMSAGNHTLKGSGADAEERADMRFLHDLRQLEEILAWQHGATLRGLNIKRDEEGWFVMLKGQKDDENVIHFTGSRTFSDALECLIWEVADTKLNWRTDKYP